MCTGQKPDVCPTGDGTARSTAVQPTAEPDRTAGLRAHDPELMRALSDILKDKPGYRGTIIALAETMRQERNINHKQKAREQIHATLTFFAFIFGISFLISWVMVMADMSVYGSFLGMMVMSTWLATMGMQYAFVREMDEMNMRRTWNIEDAHHVNCTRIMFVVMTGAALFLEWALIVTTKDPAPDDSMQNLAVGLSLIAMAMQLFLTLSPKGVGVVFFEHHLND
jgi:hypothetical protein